MSNNKEMDDLYIHQRKAKDCQPEEIVVTLDCAQKVAERAFVTGYKKAIS